MAEPIGTKKHSLLDHMMGEGGLHVHGEGDDAGRNKEGFHREIS